jgi:phage shock protein E
MFILLTNCPFTIIDVRTPNEYAKGHVPGALNIPFEEMPLRLNEVRLMPRPIITYCKSGNQSRAVISYLKEKGLDHVYNGGGLLDMLRSAQ